MKNIVDKAIRFYSANQNENELYDLLTFIPAGQKIVLEIGVEFGGTFFCWSHIASPDALLIGIDWEVEPCSAPFADRHNPSEEELKSICLPTQELILLKGKSQDKNIVEKVKEILNGQKIDLLHIDGNHSYEGCKSDFENYSNFVNGLIIFHDIKGEYPMFGVKKFWEELQGDKKEIFYKQNPCVRGFGILSHYEK